MQSQADKKLIKRLAHLIVGAGEGGVGQLGPALDKLLFGRSSADRQRFLTQLSKVIKREWKKRTLTIESASKLDDGQVDEIQEIYTSSDFKPVEVIQKICPELIAGLRVRMGDTVFDTSVQGNLDSLAERIH